LRKKIGKKTAAALELLEAKEKEEKLKREQEEKERQERDKKLREEGKLKEEDYLARQEQARKERLEREEKIKKERDEMLAKLQSEREKDKAKVGTSTPVGSSAYTSGPPRVLHGTDALLAWAARCCEPHGIAINNFTTDWKDGMAFSALVAYHFPNEINMSAAKTKTPLERLELAFDVAGRNGVPPLLDPEDVCEIPTPDRRSMITYLGCLYKGFRAL